MHTAVVWFVEDTLEFLAGLKNILIGHHLWNKWDDIWRSKKIDSTSYEDVKDEAFLLMLKMMMMKKLINHSQFKLWMVWQFIHIYTIFSYSKSRCYYKQSRSTCGKKMRSSELLSPAYDLDQLVWMTMANHHHRKPPQNTNRKGAFAL